MKFGIRLMEGKDRYQDALHNAVLAEELGYDSVWLGEHHLITGPYWPSPHLALAGIATATDNLILGTNILVLPLAQPIRIAGEFSLLAQMNEGPVVFGVSTGWRETEYEAMGIPRKMRGKRMVEYVNVIKKLWKNENVEHHGDYLELSDVTLSPQVTERPEIWVGGYADGAFDLVASEGDAWLPGRTNPSDKIIDSKRKLEGKLEEGDNTLNEWPIGRNVAISHSHEKAMDKAITFVEEVYGVHESEGNPVVNRQDYQNLEEYIRDTMIVGNPTECVEQIELYSAEIGFNHLILSMWHPDMSREEFERDMELFSDEVTPHINQ